MTKMHTNTIATISQQSTGSIKVHHTSSVSSANPTTTCVSSMTELPQGALIHIVCIITVEDKPNTLNNCRLLEIKYN